MRKSTLTLNKIAIFHKKLAKFARSNLKPFLFTTRKSRILGTLLFLVLKSIISNTKFSNHFLAIFSELTLSHFCQKAKNRQRSACKFFIFLLSKYLAKIDAIHQNSGSLCTIKLQNKPNPRQPHIKKATKHTKTKPKATKWAGFVLKNSHSHPTPTSYLITCFGITSVRTCTPPPKQKLNRTKRLALAT